MSTVDGFQGREKEVIILSLVRSNEERELGFVTDFRRLNVAVTRARRLLVVVGDSETFEKNELVYSLIKHIIEHGLIQTAETYLSNDLSRDIEIIENVSGSKISSNSKTKSGKSSLVSKKNKTNENEPPAARGRQQRKLENENKANYFGGKGLDFNSSANRKKYNIFENIADEDDSEGNFLRVS